MSPADQSGAPNTNNETDTDTPTGPIDTDSPLELSQTIGEYAFAIGKVVAVIRSLDTSSVSNTALSNTIPYLGDLDSLADTIDNGHHVLLQTLLQALNELERAEHRLAMRESNDVDVGVGETDDDVPFKLIHDDSTGELFVFFFKEDGIIICPADADDRDQGQFIPFDALLDLSETDDQTGNGDGGGDDPDDTATAVDS